MRRCLQQLSIVTAFDQRATKSAAPVGNNVGKAQRMQPSVLKSLMGDSLTGRRPWPSTAGDG